MITHSCVNSILIASISVGLYIQVY